MTEARPPAPTFHHIHINSVDPQRSLEWYSTYWPQGTNTTYAGSPAFYDDIYLLYTQVDAQAAGGFDRQLQRSEPQSGFWTFGSTFAGPNTEAFRARIAALDSEAFELVTLYGGPGGGSTSLHSLGLPLGEALLPVSEIDERIAANAEDPPPPATTGLDFGYLVDPDGMLVEFTAGRNDSFRSHTHFWAEQPLCIANWHVEHQVVDHIGLAYPDLDAVIAHFEARMVPILEGPNTLGETRAVLVEDPNGLAFELIEALD